MSTGQACLSLVATATVVPAVVVPAAEVVMAAEVVAVLVVLVPVVVGAGGVLEGRGGAGWASRRGPSVVWRVSWGLPRWGGAPCVAVADCGVNWGVGAF